MTFLYFFLENKELRTSKVFYIIWLLRRVLLLQLKDNSFFTS